MSLQGERTINGSWGELRDENGDWISHAQDITFTLRIRREEIHRSGTTKVAYKRMGSMGEGRLRQYKVSSAALVRMIRQYSNEREPLFSGQLMVKLDDPDSLGVERILLKQVKFWEIDGGFRVNEIIDENLEFTFEDIDDIDQILGNPNVNAGQYTALS